MKKIILFLIYFLCSVIFLNAANSVITIQEGASITLDANGDSKSYLINTGEDDGQIIVNSGASFTCWAPEALIDFTTTGDGNITLASVLSAFTAQFIENIPTIYWSTNSETDNMGWFIYRNFENNFTTSQQISDLIEGHGTTNQPQSYIYEDTLENPQPGDTLYYWLESIDYSGIIEQYNRAAQMIIPEEYDPGNVVIPKPIVYGLYQNFPNPLRSSAEIGFALHESSCVKLDIFNTKGQKVITLLDDYAEADKVFTMEWEGVDQYGKKLANGIYFYRLHTDTKDIIRKLLIVK